MGVRLENKKSVNKTVYTIFNRAGKHLVDRIHLHYNNKQLKAERNVKFLGFTLDPALNLNEHIKTVTARAQKRLNMLRSIKGRSWGAFAELILSSYKVLIRPIIDTHHL